MQQWVQQKREIAQSFYRRHEKYWPVLFFIGGFIFDLCMLDRIDSPMVIGQQAAYILIAGLMLGQIMYEEKSPLNFETMGWLKRQYYHHRLEVLHFFIGTLLNAYTIFYFKSSSLMVSFGFLAFLVGLLIINEMPRFRSMEVPFKFALLALCTFSFFAYVVPIFAGYMSTSLFLFSLLLGYTPFVLAGWIVQRRSAVLFELMKSSVLLPATAVLVVFLGAYLLGLIPPAPLSIRFIGVYHSVDRASGTYQLGSERPWWRFWENGDQEFYAQPGDKIFVFFRVFSPTHFSDQVIVAWYHKDLNLGWRREDAIPIHIVGGRAEGFRGYGFKANYEPGRWRAQVETVDGREIGRIYFSLELEPAQPRTLVYDSQ